MINQFFLKDRIFKLVVISFLKLFVTRIYVLAMVMLEQIYGGIRISSTQAK